MTLIDLEAVFLRIEQPGKLYQEVETLAEAQGVRFLCPKCYADNLGPIGTHSVICWFFGHGVSDDEFPKPGRWVPAGHDLSDLTLNEPPGKSRSVLLTGGCRWHGFVTNGKITQ